MSVTTENPAVPAVPPTEIADRIHGFVRARFPQVEIAPNQDIFAMGFINSLFAMELVMFIEKTFGRSVPNDELRIDNFRTVEAMAGLVGRLRLAVSDS
ncbi:acyl carrier protein [Streptomyces alkaliphilus]|uniref:Acyl carrier protein n=1 Tax=Streptomyces alkaliphilus TaxID=1472722 RepID=A0A7W3TED9_9ACTN|nr:acyl carrier protein [Streptomyces alkaliphilus]MBB0245177.1 acyl carrier protein [Streptomyces alkaliphilus]